MYDDNQMSTRAPTLVTHTAEHQSVALATDMKTWTKIFQSGMISKQFGEIT